MFFFNQITHATEKSLKVNVVQNKHFKPSKFPEISPVVEMTIEAVDVLRSALNSKSNLASEPSFRRSIAGCFSLNQIIHATENCEAIIEAIERQILHEINLPTLTLLKINILLHPFPEISPVVEMTIEAFDVWQARLVWNAD